VSRARDENAAVRAPVATYVLLAANAAAFVWQLGAGLDVSAFRGGAIPFEILTLTDVDLPDLVPPPLTILTSLFLHAGFLHLSSNLLVLWMLGRGVESALGPGRLAALHLAAGVAGALAQTVAAAAAGDLMVPIVGASGAIAGVLAAYMTLFPRARVLALPVPALIGAWFVLQIASVLFGGGPGVAFFAHIGGFVAGLVLVRTLGRRRGRDARRICG